MLNKSRQLHAFFIIAIFGILLTACSTDSSSSNDTTVPLAIIETHEGNTEMMTANDLMEKYDANEANFNTLYKGAKISFTGTVKKIKTNCAVCAKDGEVESGQNKIVFEEGWCLIVGADTDLTNYNKDEKLNVITGIVGAPFDTDFVKQVCDNERVVWLIGNDCLFYDSALKKAPANNISTIITK